LLHRIRRGEHYALRGLALAPISRIRVRARGARNGNAQRLAGFDFNEVLALRQRGLSQQAIADRTGLAQSTVSQILLGRHWSQRSAN
jgi:hypothetical protein